MAEGFAKRSATIRQVCADRADRATKRCEIYAERAGRVRKHIKADVEQTGKAKELMAEQEKSADSPEQLTDKCSNELAVEAVEKIFKLADVPEQPANTQIDCDLPTEAAKSQDKLTKVPEQPADKPDNELADKTAEIQDKAAKKTNFFKTMVGKVAELLRAHQRKHRSSPPKPESNCNKSSKKRMSFFEHIGQSATLCTMATPHTSAGTRF